MELGIPGSCEQGSFWARRRIVHFPEQQGKEHYTAFSYIKNCKYDDYYSKL